MTHFPPKRILVAYDLSALAAAAWKRAVALAVRFGAEVEAVYVEEWQPGAELSAMPAPTMGREAKKALRRDIHAAVGAGAKVTMTSGDPATSIIHVARNRRADLIVMGTHGRKGLTRALLGSVTEDVARRSPVPVLAVRGEGAEIEGVLAPVNFTDYSYYGFTYAAAAAAALGVELTALHVHVDPIWNGSPERKLKRLLESLPAPMHARCRTAVATRESVAAEGIVKAGTKRDLVVLVALVAHEKSALKELILGTTAERVLRGSRASVLVVPAPGKRLPVRASLPAPCCAA